MCRNRDVTIRRNTRVNLKKITMTTARSRHDQEEHKGELEEDNHDDGDFEESA